MRSGRSVALIVILLAYAYACSSGGPAPIETSVTVDISPSGGKLTLDEMTLEIPPGALEATTRVTVRRSGEPVPEGYTAYTRIFRVEPDGLALKVPAYVTMRHAEGEAPALLWAARLDPTFFERIDGQDDQASLRASIDHFGGGFTGAEHCRSSASCTVGCRQALSTCSMTNGTTERVRPCTCTGGRLACDREELSRCSDAGTPTVDASPGDGGDRRDSGDAAAAAPTVACIAQVHGPGRQVVADVAVAGDGRIAVVGNMIQDGSADFGDGVPIVSTGPVDGFVAVYGPACNLLWRARFGGTREEILTHAAFDGSGNLILAGTNAGSMDFGKGVHTTAGSYDVVVAKFDASYAIVWSKQFGDLNNQGIGGLGADAAGNVYLAGRTATPFDFGCPGNPATSRLYLTKLGPTGTCLFQKSFATTAGSLSDHYLRHMAVDGAGNIAITGLVPGAGGSVDLGGGPMSGVGGAGSVSAFVGRLDASGAHVWSRVLPVRGDESVALAPSLDVFVSLTLDTNGPQTANLGTGDITGSVAVARLSAANGATLWSRGYHTGFAWGSASAATAQGGLVFTTGARGPAADFGRGPLAADDAGDIALARLAADGSHVYSQHFGEIGTQQFHAHVATTPSGQTVLAGAYYGTINFGGELLPNADPLTEDVFVTVFSR